MVLLYNASILEIRQGNFCVINIFRFRHSITGFPLSLRDFGDFGDFDGGGGGGSIPALAQSLYQACSVNKPFALRGHVTSF